MTQGAANIVQLLAEEGIQLKGYTPGRTQHIRCPKCEGGRTKETSLAVTIDDDGDGARWKCHRGSCGWQDGGRVWRPGEDRPRPAPAREERAIVKPKPHVTQAKPSALYDFFEKRGIGPDTVDAFGCYIAAHWFPESGEHAAKEYPAIVFPYVWRGELVNRKYRPPFKNPQMQDKDALPTLFNVDAIAEPDGSAAEVVHWVEGEPDVMALHEAGYTRTVTLKDGAPDKLREEDDPARQEDKRFAALEVHAELLDGVKRFVLCGDMDEPGQVLREELARRLGRHRCWLVTWPDGCKDAGDVLRIHGSQAVQEALEQASPYPIEGLQKPTGKTLLALRHSAPPVVLTTGTPDTDRIMRFPGEGRLIVITGVPSHGKTTWLIHVMVHLMVTHRRRFVVFTPEMQPWEHFAAMLSTTFIGKSFWPNKHLAADKIMDDTEIAHAERWLRERLTMIVSDAVDAPPTADWLLDMTRISVLREGTTDLIIDPWNEVEHTRPERMSEVEYLGRALQQLKAFGLRHGVNVWIVAHPKNLQPVKPGSNKVGIPGPYDIAGGAMWANKTDLGITVHRGDDDLTQIHLWKPRFRRWGKRNSVAKIEFDQVTGRYRSPANGLFDNANSGDLPE